MYISIEDLARRYGIDNDQAIAFLKEVMIFEEKGGMWWA